jgi:hypothetical protein
MSIGDLQKPDRIVGMLSLRTFAAAALLGAVAATAAGCGGGDSAETVAAGGSGGGNGGQGGAEASAGTDGQAGADVSAGSGGQAGLDSSAGGTGGVAGNDGQAGADVSAGGTAGSDAGDSAAAPDRAADAVKDGALDVEAACGCSCQVEVCNGVDDNCNGQTDESDPRFGQDCNTTDLGACAAGKFTRCSAGQIVCTSQLEAGTRVETCNNIDDDCDGITDNNLVDPRLGVDCAVSGKAGECAKGKVRCVTGNVVCGQVFLPTTETCNGKDDDCDGVVDNPAAVTGASCNTGALGECAAGTTTCGDAGVGCAPLHVSVTEICNGLDDNCDGLTDNVTGTSNTCATDNPGAAHVSTWGCSSGSSCTVGGCDTGWNDIDKNPANGCECGATDRTMSTCSPAKITFDVNKTSETLTASGVITTLNGDAWFDVEFRPYAVKTTSATGVYRSIEMTNTGDGGYTIEYFMPALSGGCSASLACPLTGGVAGGIGDTKWELNLTHDANCALGSNCSDTTTSIPPIIRVHVKRAQPPACYPFTITAINKDYASQP